MKLGSFLRVNSTLHTTTTSIHVTVYYLGRTTTFMVLLDKEHCNHTVKRLGFWYTIALYTKYTSYEERNGIHLMPYVNTCTCQKPFDTLDIHTCTVVYASSFQASYSTVSVVCNEYASSQEVGGFITSTHSDCLATAHGNRHNSQ